LIDRLDCSPFHTRKRRPQSGRRNWRLQERGDRNGKLVNGVDHLRRARNRSVEIAVLRATSLFREAPISAIMSAVLPL